MYYRQSILLLKLDNNLDFLNRFLILIMFLSHKTLHQQRLCVRQLQQQLKNVSLQWRPTSKIMGVGLLLMLISTTRLTAGGHSPKIMISRAFQTFQNSLGITSTQQSTCQTQDIMSIFTTLQVVTRSGNWAEEEFSQMLSHSMMSQHTNIMS